MKDKVIKIMLGWIEHNEPIETTADKILDLFGVSQVKQEIEIDYEKYFIWGNDEILGYKCMDCENLQDHESGFGCNVCSGHSLEAWYG